MYFSLTQASQILGFRVERLRDWVNLGYIRPDIEAAGRGSKNLFTKWDLYRIKLFDYLVNHGLSREEACMRCDEFNKFLNIEKKALDEIKEAGQASALVVHGAKTVVADAARKTSERVFSLRLRYLMICKNKGIYNGSIFKHKSGNSGYLRLVPAGKGREHDDVGETSRKLDRKRRSVTVSGRISFYFTPGRRLRTSCIKTDPP